MKKHFLGRLFCLILGVVMVIGVAGCTSNKKPDNTPKTTYTVTFDVQGHGTAPETQTVTEGGHATQPTAPAEEGWQFGGWYKESACTSEYRFTTETVTTNITLYAKWTEKTVNPPVDPDKTTYTVTFDAQGHGTAPKAQTVNEGGYASEPTALTESGWQFGGWYKESACTNAYNFTTEKVTKNITLYAKWTEATETPDPLPTNEKPTIYLAGDSTVQGYSATQYIAGWGQYLGLFLDEDIEVVNCARGGRSSRSFINEDRLFASTDGTKYNFSENGGKSIEETIQAGDYLFIQFGHNDDATKGYQTMPDRMVPLGEPDANGIYPVTAPAEQKATTWLPEEYLSQATSSEKSSQLSEIAKYGATYYAFGDGTFKWYLKQYIDLAREKGAIPVLLTPVARRSFKADGTLRDGPGLHGDNFAYVQAVRQLAQEENCLLIDNFAYTKETLETITPAFADFLLALVPNSLNGEWPSGYDNDYNNPDSGYTGMENTHYNKYGAYLTAAYVAESILKSNEAGTVKGSDEAKEYYNFSDYVLITPRGYVAPSNRVSISKIAEIEGMFEKVNPTDPNRAYTQPSVAIEAINALKAKGEISSITEENYELWKGYCEKARAVYESLNFDLRSGVTNYDVLLAYEAAVKDARPKPTTTVVLNANNFTNVNTPITDHEHTFSFHSEIVQSSKQGAAFNYNGVQYSATTKAIQLKGNGKVTSASPIKYIEFTLTGPATVTIVASGGQSAGTIDVEWRTIQMVNVADSSKVVSTYDIPAAQVVISNEIAEGGTYRIASKGSNIDIYYIIIEYYASTEKPEPTPSGEEELVGLTAYDHTQNGNRVTQRLQTLFELGDKFNYENLVVYANYTVDGQDKTKLLDLSEVEIIAPDMTTAGEKTVLIKYEGKETSYKINVIDLSGVQKNNATVTVNPSADYGATGNVVTVKTINDAVTVFKLLKTDDNTIKTINVTAGTYHEKVEFDIPNLYVIGADTDATKTVIEFNLLAAYDCPGALDSYGKPAKYSTDGSASVSIRESAIGFHAENITFQNYYNTHERYLESVETAKPLGGNTMAVACLVQADKCVFDNVRFSSYHDTLYDYNGRHVYNNCYIEGRTDYIFGYGSTSLFNNCTLKTIGADDEKNGGYVCATMGYAKYTPDWTTANTKVDYGYIFNGCTITADSRVKDGTASLARAWSGYMTLAFINCDISKAYSLTPYGTKTNGKNDRYGAMNQGDPKPERLYEYGNTGAGALDYSTPGVKENLCTVLTEARKNEFLDTSVIFAEVNGQVEYSSAWNGGAGATIPTTYVFKTYEAQNMTSAFETVSLFDGAMTLNGRYRLCGAGNADGSIQLYAGSVFTLNVQGKVTIEWYPGYGTTASNAKINYKNGCATITIIGTGSNPSSDNQYYIFFFFFLPLTARRSALTYTNTAHGR